jgi:hypothetical protein
LLSDDALASWSLMTVLACCCLMMTLLLLSDDSHCLLFDDSHCLQPSNDDSHYGIFSSGYLPGFWILKVDVSEHSVGSIFTGGHVWIIHTYPPVKMEPTECSETSVFNVQTPGKYPEENISYLQHGECLKITMTVIVTRCLMTVIAFLSK